MSLENQNFDQDKSSEDALEQMKKILPEIKENINAKNIVHRYTEWIEVLRPLIIDLEKYIETKENFSEIKSQFEQIKDTPTTTETGIPRYLHSILQKYTDSIEYFEKKYPDFRTDTLEEQKNKLKALHAQLENLEKLRNEFDEDLEDYKKN